MTTLWRVGKHSKKPLIWVTFGYDTRAIELLKEIVPGLKWDRKDRMWTAPLDFDVARDIRDVARQCGARLRLEPELAAWAVAEKDRMKSLMRPDDLSKAYDPSLLPNIQQKYPLIYEAMTKGINGFTPRPWQVPGTHFIAEQRRALLADEPQLGKTVQVLSAVAENNITGAILVIAPKTAVEATWPDEIRKWLGPDEHIFKISASIKPEERKKQAQRAKELADLGHRVWVITGPNYIRIRADTDRFGNYVLDERKKKIIRVVGEAVADLFRMSWSGAIVDESQNVLACKTGNKKKWSAQRQGVGALDLVPGAMRIAISGTPFRGKTEMIWGTLNWLDPERYSSYWKWVRRHYGVEDNWDSGEARMEKGDVILDEKRFFAELRPIMVRRTYRELKALGYDIKDKLYGGTHLIPGDDSSPVAVWLTMTDDQAAQYKQIEDDALVTITALDGTSTDVMVQGSLAELTRCKQLANSCLSATTGNLHPAMPSNKVDWLLDFIPKRIDDGTKTIVVSQFTQFLYMLSKQLDRAKVGHYVFTGDTKGDERSRIKHEFQSPLGKSVILLNTISGGLSLTLDAADDIVIVDKTWIPDDQQQAENRAYGLNKKRDLRVWNLCSRGTIDEDIAVLNAEREDAIFDIMDSQRGVQFIRQVIDMTKERAAA